VQTIDGATTLHEVMQRHFGAGQAHRAFPVTCDGVLLGMLDRAHAVEHLARDAGATAARACLPSPPLPAAPSFVLPGESCRAVATRLARERLERLPVVKDARSLRLVGIVARSDLIKLSLVHFDEEEKRERLLSLPWQTGP
jgi:CBS-domain-containing membrane protein